MLRHNCKDCLCHRWSRCKGVIVLFGYYNVSNCNQFIHDHSLSFFSFKLFSEMYFAQINIILVFPLFERDPLPIRCRQTHESEMSF